MTVMSVQCASGTRPADSAAHDGGDVNCFRRWFSRAAVMYEVRTRITASVPFAAQPSTQIRDKQVFFLMIDIRL